MLIFRRYAQAARVFESQLADSLLEGDGQLAFKKLAAATVETLMPKIETKGEFGQARWRLVSAPQVPNLLSLDPTTDPFKSLANLSFGAEVEVQLGKHLQVPFATLDRKVVKLSEIAFALCLHAFMVSAGGLRIYNAQHRHYMDSRFSFIPCPFSGNFRTLAF